MVTAGIVIGLLAAPIARPHGLCIMLDYNTLCHLPNWSVEGARDQLEWLLREYKRCGVVRVFFRVDVQGRVAYQGHEMKPYEGYPGWPPSLELLLATGADPLSWFVEICNELGIEPWGWIALFDSGGQDALGDPFFYGHPEYMWQSRDGTQVIWGRPCYAYPEVRQHRVREAIEVAQHGVRGLLFHLRSHARTPYGNLNTDWGFNEPVVEDYKRLYGADPRELELWQTDAGCRFVMLKCSYVTRLMREVRAALPNVKLMLDDGWNVFPEQWGEPKLTAPEKCIAEGIIDEVMTVGSPYWVGRIIDHPPIPMTWWVKVYGGGINTPEKVRECCRIVQTQWPQKRFDYLALFEASRLWWQVDFDAMRECVEAYDWMKAPPARGDINFDGVIDHSDVEAELDAWLGKPSHVPYHMDLWPTLRDGRLTIEDVLAVAKIVVAER